jgi:heat shock protein HtpX
MLLVLVLGLAFDAALVAAMIIYAASGEGRWLVPALLAVVGCVAAVAHARRLRSMVIDDPDLVRRYERTIEPLCLLANLAPPNVTVISGRAPLSWASVRPFSGATIYLTQALIDEASDGELQAVLAHELSHLVDRDAIVMSLVAGPPTLVLRAIQFAWRGDRDNGWVLGWASFPWLIASPVPLAICRILSRYRELAADRGAAVLTGSPSEVAAALMRLSKQLPTIPLQDLRATGTSDLFHFLPSREPTDPVGRIWATHPPVAICVRHLTDLESELQRARTSSPAL